jgi:glutathione S-transferase
MNTLYYAPGTAALVVHWLLIDLDVPHALRKLDLDAGEQKQPWYLALNPMGVVPTLVLDDQPLCEAAAIALHLADAYPARHLAPPVGTPARAAYYRWMMTCANGLQPAFRGWFNPGEPAGEANTEAAKQAARARIEATWAIVDAHLAAAGPYLLGETASAADFMLTMLMRWSRNMPRPAHSWPALLRLATLMKARPSFRELYAREGLTEWA